MFPNQANKMSVILRYVNIVGPKRILVFILLTWFTFLLFTTLPVLNTHISPCTDQKTAERLERALADLESIRKQNVELQEIFKDIAVG